MYRLLTGTGAAIALLLAAGCATTHPPIPRRSLAMTDLEAGAFDDGAAAPVVSLDHGRSFGTAAGDAQEAVEANDEELAKKLSNPIANLISVPFQLNTDRGIGPKEDGKSTVLKIQPVIPFELNDEWNVISRTIVPLIDQHDVAPGIGDQSGIGDITQSFFFSPKAPTESGVIWGVGPAILLPAAHDDLLGSGKWGLGPTGVALKQEGPWTYGALANHIWSVAGDDDRRGVNSTFLQPFLTYTTPSATSYGLNTESTYDWEIGQWSTPVNAFVSQLLKIGGQPVQIGAGIRYWVDSPDNGAEGFGFRMFITPLFPK